MKISYVGLGNMVNAALGFIFLSVVARSLAVDEFGKYALLTSLLIFLGRGLDFGTNSTYVAKVISTQEQGLADHFVSVKFVLFLVALAVSLILLKLFGLGSTQVTVIFVLGLIFYGINYTLFGLFQELEHYTALVLLNTIPALIKGLFAVLIFLNWFEFSFSGLFMIFTFSIGPSALVYWLLPRDKRPARLDFSRLGTTIKEALSPGISQLIQEGFPAISNSLTKVYSNFTNVGIFSLADKISHAFVLVSFTIFTVLLPQNAQRKKANKTYDYKETAWLSLGVLVLSLLTMGLARLFVPWFFQGKYDQSLSLVNILVASGALSAIHTFMENYFFVEGKTKYLAFISGGKLALLLMLSLILIPILSLKGLALAHLLASLATLGVVISLMSRQKTVNQPV